VSANANTSRSQKLSQVLATLGKHADDIIGLLPPDLPLERFYANVTNALSSNPALLDCEAQSIVQACMKAAYDGLRIDGREAVIVGREMTYDKNKASERKVKLAHYMPMAFGLIQQVLRGGEVKSIVADVIRANDEYHVQRGTAPGIHHIPKLDGPRGDIIAAYSVATWASGAMTFELLTKEDLGAIQGASQTDMVWKRWPGEMSKKSAIRRHRKTLPLGNRDIVIRDAEADALFPEMQPGQESLPAPAQTARPTRQAIADRQGAQAGADIDLGDDDGVVVEQAQQEKRAKVRQAGKAKDPVAAGQADIPATEEEWRGWAVDVETRVNAAADADAVNTIASAEEGRMVAASKERRDYLRGLISDRLADFAVLTREGIWQ